MEELMVTGNTVNSFSLVPTRVPVSIIFQDIGELNPKDDITPLESTRIAMLLAVCTTQTGYYKVTYEDYIKKHGLERHFDK